MSWGGVSETIRGACPLCQDGCPPECRSLKPYGYADAPDWQKAAWDSEINKKMRAMAESMDVPKDILEVGSWIAPSEVIYGHQPDEFILPALSVPRGGIKYPRFRVETMVVPKVRGWIWQRRTWSLHVCYWDPERQKNMYHIMEGFLTEALAGNAAEIIKFAVQAINKDYDVEKVGEKWSQL
jgi:hypothetical protein